MFKQILARFLLHQMLLFEDLSQCGPLWLAAGSEFLLSLATFSLLLFFLLGGVTNMPDSILNPELWKLVSECE
jgi:hypothetical protein